MTLRTAILISVLLLILATVAATVVAVERVSDRAAVRAVHEEVAHSRAVFAGLAAERQAQLMRMTAVMADEPRLKALANSDADRRTILGVARDLHGAVGTEIFVLVDGQGALIVDMLAPDEEGADLLGMPAVASAFSQGGASSVWVDTNSIYEVHAQRLSLGAHTIGALVLGRAIDDEVAVSIHEQTGTSVVVLLDGLVVAASALPGAATVDRVELARVLMAVNPHSDEVTDVELGGARFVAMGGRLSEYEGSADVRYVLLRNLDVAMEPGRRLTRILYMILAIAALCAVFLAMVLSRRLSRPLDKLCSFTEKLGHGDLRARCEVGGFTEVAHLAEAMNRMAAELQESRRHLTEKERLENELVIAADIQTSILPGDVGLPGLEVAARMQPASEVGGDYYDILACEDGGWLGIGDVAGHGLDAGLIMLMAQTSIATMVANEPDIAPSRLAIILNRVLYTNVKERMQSDRHMTLCLMRYLSEGRLMVAGAHLEIIYLGARAETCELKDTPGIWMGMIDDIAPMTFDTTYELEPGDLVVLYTDGLIEARNSAGEMFGLERAMDIVQEMRDQPAADICQALFDRVHDFAQMQTDDVTVLVMRYVGTSPAQGRKESHR